MVFELRMLMLVVVSGLFAFFIYLLRKQKLELKYCLIWLIALIGVALLCIFPSLIINLSNLLGIITPVYAFFLVCIAFLAGICVSLTIVVSALSIRLRKLTQNTAIMEFEKSLKDIKKD